MPFSARRLLVASLLLGLCGGCAAPQIGGPTAAKGDPAAGLLTLPSGQSVSVYPEDLAYTGEARYRWPDGREYQGSWVDGKPQGIGAESLPNGDYYRGTWKAGQRDGHGELTSQDGSRYVGDFVAGHREGPGSESSPGGVYKGQWKNGLPDGDGEYFSSNGASYKGQWREGVRHGYGRYDDGHNNSYEGDWANDSPNGFGRMEGAEGSVYEGELRNGQRHGYGRLDAGEFSYEGTWQTGDRHGYGVGRTPDGGSYTGSWQNGNRHGPGRAANADGSYHDGVWVEDQPDGPGTRVDISGISVTGDWTDDRVASGTLVLPGGASYSGALMTGERSLAQPFVSWLETQAATGNPDAQYYLGLVLQDYQQPPPDPQRALTLLLAAARAGVADAAYRAALTISQPGASQNTDPKEQIRLLTQAAASGHIAASALLGNHYASGTYVARDTSVAVTYFTQASEGGNLAARNNLAWILATYPDDMIRDGNQALALIEPLASLYENWRHLDTLAAAYAELGEFELAASTQKHALLLVEQGSTDGETMDPVQLENMRARLQLYQQGKRFRESSDSFKAGI